MEALTSVPCNGCTVCCRVGHVPLAPGEELRFRSMLAPGGLRKLYGRWILAHKPSGECIYLGDAGCTIHNAKPLACDRYDCRSEVAKHRDPARAIATGRLEQAIFDAARKMKTAA